MPAHPLRHRFTLFFLSMSIATGLGAPIANANAAFDLQGHRGARGLVPENTIGGFAKALAIGVSTLELDVGVTEDGIAVVSHEPRLNPALTRDNAGRWLVEPTPSIHALSYADLADYDVGRLNPDNRYARRFPDQQPIDGERIPRLTEVFDLVNRSRLNVRFNIETKISPINPALTASPKQFVRAIMAALSGYGLEDRVTIQSFDWRTLALVQAKTPKIPTAYLTVQQRWLNNIRKGEPGPSPWTGKFDIDDYAGSVPGLVHAAGGRIWSPFHKELNAGDVNTAHQLGLKIIPWTVNDPDRMGELIDMQVDGLITDYPDRLRSVMQERGLAVPQQWRSAGE